MTSCLLIEIRLSARVLEHDLRDVGLRLVRRLGFRRQVDVETALRERQGGHEDDEEHEQHVDHRRDVHVAADFELLGGDDLVGAEMLVGVSHVSSLPRLAGRARRSVMRPMSSIPAARSSSIASITLP